MKDQPDHRPRRSTTMWLARVAAGALGPTRTGAPVVAIARGSLSRFAAAGNATAKIGRDLTLFKAVAA